MVESVSLLVAFSAGLLSFLSPCVLPLVPSYVTFITGLSLDEVERKLTPPAVRRTAALHSLAFIAGFSMVFVLLGASATAAGQFLRDKPVGYLGTSLVGVAFAAGWTPCIGPILGTILTLAATAERVRSGVLLL